MIKDPEGEAVRMGDLIDKPTVVVLPRYYGCLPCRDYLRSVAAHYGEIEAIGAGAIGVSVGADYQAKWVASEYELPFPLFVDPDRELLGALELKRNPAIALRPSGLKTYARAMRNGNRQGLPVSPLQAPGLAILDANAKVINLYRGKALGDYPPIEQTMEWIREAAAVAA